MCVFVCTEKHFLCTLYLWVHVREFNRKIEMKYKRNKSSEVKRKARELLVDMCNVQILAAAVRMENTNNNNKKDEKKNERREVKLEKNEPKSRQHIMLHIYYTYFAKRAIATLLHHTFTHYLPRLFSAVFFFWFFVIPSLSYQRFL